MRISEIIQDKACEDVSADMIMHFGNPQDGVIEFPAKVEGGVVEVGYFFGSAKPKNIIDISSQLGCLSRCSFCEVGQERFGRNLTANEIYEQAVLMLQIASLSGVDIDSIKHKVSIAKTGEPLFNPSLTSALEKLATLPVSFKISTIFPDSKQSKENYDHIVEFASDYSEPVQLQVSLISTSEDYRKSTAGINVVGFNDLREAGELWRNKVPNPRKVNLSLILTEQVPCSVKDVRGFFPSDLFRFRFRPYVPTDNGTKNSLSKISLARFDQIKDEFQQAGYDVGEWATPTPTEQRFGLAANVTRRRYLNMLHGKI